MSGAAECLGGQSDDGEGGQSWPDPDLYMHAK